jgi:dTDP-glucose 4,6-dehydratase/UDP-glucuronate decarboxylase
MSIVTEDVDFILTEMAEVLKQVSGTTLLVTGAGGFLCSYFLEVVAAFNRSGTGAPCRVIALDNFRTGLPERLSHLSAEPNLRFVRHDVSQPFQSDEPVDWIIHGASIASPSFYRRFPLETIDVNVNGTRHLLESARHGARSMLYLSTSEVYGDPDPAMVPTPETYHGNVSCTGPRACYDESKRLAETLCAAYHRLFSVPIKVVRPFNVYGPGQRLDDGRIIPDLMSAALNRKPIVLYSDGRATRTFCYVRDAIRAMWRVLLSDADGEIFNIGNDAEELSIGALAQRMGEVAGPPWLEIEQRVSQDPHYVTDNPQRRCPDLRKLRTRFGWQPQVSLTEGLKRTLQSYREQGQNEK